ncbi:MAG: tetratricopeptide repeat protein [Treponema sp.]|nr:tetratricopeptide repeat protein [Treponema sp.]
MKQSVRVCAVLLLFTFRLAADTASLSSSLDADYKNGFYPGVVRSANEILRTSPNSPAAVRAAVYKGESLYRMGRIEEAEASLLAVTPDTQDLTAARAYWLGRIAVDRSDWKKALSLFLESAVAAKDSPESSVYYAYSLFYAGNAWFSLGEFEKARPLYAYVLSHGTQYAGADYEKAAVSQLSALLALSRYKEAASLAARFEKAPFTEDVRFRIMLASGDAASGTGDFKGAYSRYCAVLSSASANLAAEAMQKAYAVSSAHRREVGEEPGSLLKQAEERLSLYPELLAEFWLRLSIDAFSAKDGEKASRYFAETERAARLCAEKDAEKADRILILTALYRMELESAGGKTAKEVLEAFDERVGAKNPASSNPLFGTVCAARARFYGLSGDWKNCAAQADAALAAGPAAVLHSAAYWKAVSLYQTGAYSDACAFIEQQQRLIASLKDDIAFQTLYARALAHDGRLHDADVLFYALGEQGALDNDGTLDYVKSLMNGGYMVSASTQAGKATGAEAAYLSALAAFNRRQWKEASAYFAKSLAAGSLDSTYVPYARFYSGYAQYRSGDYRAAYATLTAFISDRTSRTHQLRFLALMTAARSSVQAGSYSQAFPLAEEAIRAAQNDSQKQEAVLLCAGVYTDAAQYDKALAVLLPYASGRTEFAWQCRYKTAQIQAQKKDFAAADKTYAALAREKAAGTLAEEAAYRRGELAYSSERYADAVSLFDEYCRKWGSGGQFFDAARFFSAGSLVRTGDADRAILYYQQVDNLSFPSPYKYSAEKNLMELYKNQRDYQKAISFAQKLLDGYGEQAENDGIALAIDELHKLELGYDEPTAAKEQEYERLGKTRTRDGRVAGTELAVMWAGSAIYKQRAASLSEALLSVQVKNLPDEAAGAAQNALIVAKYLREQSENTRAAELYLQAAGYARSAGDDNASSQALYGAVEAFDAARRYGDARATAKQLEQLYPKSRFVEAAKNIVEQGE